MAGPVLITGATGLLGQALMGAARSAGLDAVGLARHGADVVCDLVDGAAVNIALDRIRPECIINAAAITNLSQCESDPAAAQLVNARAPAILAEWCRANAAKIVQISTDHYYCGDGAAQHDETAHVTLVNEYARTKYAGEAAVLSDPEALVVRTNITGWRGWPGKPTFFEWVVAALEKHEPMTLFSDFHTSTIDAPSCARHIFALVARNARGVVNLAARDVADKETFVRFVARVLGIALDNATPGSVQSLRPRRAESLGLDVSKAESLLGLRLPAMHDVVHALLSTRPA